MTTYTDNIYLHEFLFTHLTFCFFFSIIRPPPRSTLFPSPTLFRSSCQMASAAWTNSAAVHWMADSIPPPAAANETFDHSRAPPIALSASINHAPVSPNARRSTQRSAPPTTPPPLALRPVYHSAPRGTRAWYAATETSAIRAAPHALRPRRECSDARSRAIPPSTPASGISHAPSPSATRWTCSRTSGTPVAPGRNES